MTDTATITPAELEARLAELERRLGVDPAALVPPITIGELTDVPAPGSQLAATWAQEVSSRVVQRFPNVAALKAWAAPTGSFAVAVDTGVLWRKVAAGWSQQTPWQASVAGIAAGGSGVSPINSIQLAVVNVPPDPGPRIITIAAFVVVEKFMPAARVDLRIEVNGASAAEANIDPEIDPSTAGVRVARTLTLYAQAVEASPATVTLKLGTGASGAEVATRASPAYNRLDVTVTPRGY